MKINEIVTEGIWDSIKQIGAGAKGLYQTKSLAGARDASQQATGLQQMHNYVRKAQQDWNVYRGKTGHTDILSWAKNYFDNPNINIQPENINSSADVQKFLTGLVQDYESREIYGKEPMDQQPQKTNPSPGKVVPNLNVPGFTVVNKEPIVVRYQKKDYALNNRGEWQLLTPRGTKAPLIKDTNPTLEKLLDKAAGLK
jgi:hypothetical protein